MTNLFIQFVYRFRKFIEFSGVDFDQFIAILRVKLTIDNRRTGAVALNGISATKTTNFAYSNMLIILALLGFFLSLILLISPTPLISASIYHGIVMIVTMMIFVSDFSAVLLDTTDNFILLPRPVSGRTIVAARLTHIFIYLMGITYSLAATSFFVMAFKFGIVSSVIHFLILPFNTLFAIVIASFLYLIIIRFSSEEKLKDVINGFQILMMITLTMGSQILPRLGNFGDSLSENLELNWMHMFLPPMWFGGAIDTLSSFKFDKFHLVLTILCLFIPVSCLFLINKFFSNFFSTKLSAFSNDAPSVRNKTTPSVFKPSNGIAYYLGKWFTKIGEERSAFYIVWHLVLRDRKLKLKLYPQWAYSIFILFSGFLGGINSDTAWQQNLIELKEGNIYLLYAYFTGISLFTCIGLIPFSDDFKAAWVYTATPIVRPGDLFMGTIKAIIFKVFTPLFLIMSIVVLGIWGIKTLDDLILVYINAIIFSVLTSKLDRNYLPFSQEHNIQQQGGNFGMMMVLMLMTSVMGAMHYFFATYTPWLVTLMIPLMATALYFLIKDYREMSWKNFESIHV
jgi:ABC-2 type transport system permease protein